MEWLLRQCASNPPELAQVVERYRSRWTIQEWQLDERNGDLLGPGGFVVTCHPEIVEIDHTIRFSQFAGDVESREELRKIWKWFGRLLGSSRAIYTHELMPHPGSNLSEIESCLRLEIGPPARDFSELASADYFGPLAWYVDDLLGA